MILESTLQFIETNKTFRYKNIEMKQQIKSVTMQT